jgi:pimeloyl-ACP methyl ester carboxylesterase
MLPHWTQNDLLFDGVRLHYYRTGNGDKRPLVLVHGFSDNGLCWTPVARSLESNYDVIMPDMRAHGLSERVQPNDKVDMASDLAELIRSLGLKRPIICGHSMGAIVTYQVGVRFPELASALVLEDPPWWMPDPEQVSLPAEATEDPMEKWAKNLANQTLDELLVSYRKDHPTWPEELLRPKCESKKQLDATIIDIQPPKKHAQEINWLTTIQNITQPMLIFAGNPSLGGIVTPEVVAKIRELNPKVNIVVVPNVGHLIRFDQYAIFIDALEGFLQRVPA